MATTALSIAKDAAQAYLTASERLDGDDLEYESKRIRHEHGIGAGICGIDISEIDQIFDDVTEDLINSPFGAPTEEDVCRAVIAGVDA